MDLTKGDLVIFSGEGEAGTWERYYGARTVKAIRSKLSRERSGGDRWAHAWIETRPGAYGKLALSFDELTGEREIPAESIRDNPAAMLRAGKPNPKSAVNGRLGGRGRMTIITVTADDGATQTFDRSDLGLATDRGYNRTEWMAALEKAGYTAPGIVSID